VTTRASTMIELLISVSIGAAICVTAFMAVRVASQAIATGNRLSLENQLLRAGVAAGLDELESWKHYDDLAAPTQPLRADKHPFHELTQSEDFNFEFHPVRDPAASYEEWWRRDSRTWVRSDPNTISGSAGDHGLGDYGLFGFYGMPNDGSVLQGAEKRWRHHLMHEISQHLGYFALVDYAPANSLFQYYVWRDGDYPAAVTPWEFFDQSLGGTGRLYAHTWEEAKPRDFIALTTGSYITVTRPDEALAAAHRTPEINRSIFVSWYSFYADLGNADKTDDGTANAGWSVDDAFSSCSGRIRPLPLRPANWPDLAINVRHYAANARQFHSATVLTKSPMTAQIFKLYFTYTGTTLRGARTVRGLDGAWP